MKKLITILTIILFAGFFFFPHQANAQPPQKMSYQAVIRNSSNTLITNHLVGMKISILQGSATGTVVYTETQTPTTNVNGLVSIEIGSGPNFNTINWGAGPYFIKTETDPAGGTNYTVTATSQLLSVPYALYAKNTLPGGATGQLQFNNNGVLGGDPDLFWDKTQKRLGIGTSGAAAINSPLDVRNMSGNAINGVSYNSGSGVSGYEYSSSSGTPGCGVSGRSTSIGGSGVKGYSEISSGLTFGVYGSVKSPDGFGVYGYNDASTGPGYGIYGQSVSSTGYGIYGLSTNIGVYGKSTSSTNGSAGVYGETTGTGTFVSAVVGLASATSGNNNGVYGATKSAQGIGVVGVGGALTGNSVGVQGITSSPNGYSGYFSGGKFYVNGNVGIGTITPSAGLHLKGTGYPGSFMFLESNTGQDAGFRIYEGATAKWHIFNDVNAGGLRMYNANAVTAIFCKQSNSFVGINTITPNYNLEVNGSAGKTGGGSWTTSSDMRLKDVKGAYTKGLKEITALQPIRFNYKTGNARHLPTDVEQIGFVAQEVQKIFPEAVTEGKDGYLDFNIHAINVALVNAVKELKAENEQLKTRIEKIEAQLTILSQKEH